MKHARPLLLAVSTLALFISACSQSDDLTAPALEPQYGTALEDAAEHVVANEAGHVFTFGTIKSYDLTYQEPVLKRFDASGRQLWSRKLGEQCSSQEGVYGCDVYVFNLATDSIGNSYVLYGAQTSSESYGNLDVTLRKYSPVGNLQWTRPIVKRGGVSREDGLTMAASAKGEVYIAYEISSYDESRNPRYTVARHLLKFNTRGEKLFDRSHNIQWLHDAAVGGDGSVYVLGVPYLKTDMHLTKYSSGGTLLWQRALPNYDDHLAVSGNSIYTLNERTPHTLSKYATNGNPVWKRSIAPVGHKYEFDLHGLSADVTGNVYLAGTTNIDGTYDVEGGAGDADLFVRKYTASGKVAWTYNPDRSPTGEIAYDVSAGDSDKVYVAGIIDVNGRTYYGGLDAFLLRLDTAGKRVWSR